MTAWTIAAGIVLAAIPIVLIGFGFAIRFSPDPHIDDGSRSFYGLAFGAMDIAAAAVCCGLVSKGSGRRIAADDPCGLYSIG